MAKTKAPFSVQSLQLFFLSVIFAAAQRGCWMTNLTLAVWFLQTCVAIARLKVKVEPYLAKAVASALAVRGVHCTRGQKNKKISISFDKITHYILLNKSIVNQDGNN